MSENSCCDPVCQSSFQPDPKWLRISFWLLIATILYNSLEGIIAVSSGFIAKSIALEGFGFDSVIEMSASLVALWRLRKQMSGGSEEKIEQYERFVGRFVGATFILLALYILYSAGSNLWLHKAPEESLVGIALAALSILVMPLLVRFKIKAAREIRSEALELEAKETLCCFYLSVILLVGLAANSLFGLWWADPVCALAMLPWLVREGLEGIKGEDCCGCS